MVHLRRYWFVTAEDMPQMCLVSPVVFNLWAESGLFPWQAQTAARVNDVIAGCAVQSALVPASVVCQPSPALQVLAQRCSESRASGVGREPISTL
jgi:hypothetical protein